MSHRYEKSAQVGGILEDKFRQLPLDSCSLRGKGCCMMGDLNKDDLEFQHEWSRKNKKVIGCSKSFDFGRPIWRYIEFPGMLLR